MALHLDVSFAEKFENIMHANEQVIRSMTSPRKIVYFKRMPGRRPFSIHRWELVMGGGHQASWGIDFERGRSFYSAFSLYH